MNKFSGVVSLAGRREWQVVMFGDSPCEVHAEQREHSINTHFAGGRVLIRDNGHHYHISSTCEMVDANHYLVTLTLTEGVLDICNEHGQPYRPCLRCVNASPRLRDTTTDRAGIRHSL